MEPPAVNLFKEQTVDDLLEQVQLMCEHSSIDEFSGGIKDYMT